MFLKNDLLKLVSFSLGVIKLGLKVPMFNGGASIVIIYGSILLCDKIEYTTFTFYEIRII